MTKDGLRMPFLCVGLFKLMTGGWYPENAFRRSRKALEFITQLGCQMCQRDLIKFYGNINKTYFLRLSAFCNHFMFLNHLNINIACIRSLRKIHQLRAVWCFCLILIWDRM